MELLVLVSLCILTFTGKSFGDETGLVKIKTDQDVTLPCSFGTLLVKRINWKKDGKDIFLYENGQVKPSSQDGQRKVQVSHFPDELKSGNASITIKQAKVSDSGTYICLFYEQGATAPSGHVKIKLIVDPPLITIKEDESVILPCSFSTSLTDKRFDWKKDGKNVFLSENSRVNAASQDKQFKGRVSNFPNELKSGNASITITKAKTSDSGNYTCLYLSKDGKEEECHQIELIVDPPLITIKEDESVILPCSFSTSLTDKRFDWKKDGMDVFLSDNPSSQDEQFKGRVSNFPNELKSGNASITITKANTSDSGTYTCLYLDGEEERQQIKLIVECILKDRTGKENGTCPKPTIRIIEKVNGGTLVECKARDAFPAPKMELQNRANITIHVGDPEPSLNGKDDYILHAVVTKEDHYHCVVTQDNICHQIYSEETLVPVSSELKDTTGEKQTGNGVPIKVVIGVVIGCIIVSFIFGVALAMAYKRYKRCRNRNSSGQQGENTDATTYPLNE